MWLMLSKWDSPLHMFKIEFLNFGVYHWVNQYSIANWVRNHQNFRLQIWFKTFTVHLKHINNYDFAKISNQILKKLHRYFQPYLCLGLVQQCLILIKCGKISLLDQKLLDQKVAENHFNTTQFEHFL